jgi:hypothetical protein
MATAIVAKHSTFLLLQCYCRLVAVFPWLTWSFGLFCATLQSSLLVESDLRFPRFRGAVTYHDRFHLVGLIPARWSRNLTSSRAKKEGEASPSKGSRRMEQPSRSDWQRQGALITAHSMVKNNSSISITYSTHLTKQLAMRCAAHALSSLLPPMLGSRDDGNYLVCC